MRRHRAIGCAGLLALLVVATLASCGSGAPEGAGVTVTPSAASPSPRWSGPSLTQGEVQAVRECGLAYYAAYNAYDADAALAYLTAEYRAEVGESIRKDIGRMKTFGAHLGVTPKAPPEAIGPGEAQLFLTVKTPIDTRTVEMRFAGGGDAWLVTFSEETE